MPVDRDIESNDEELEDEQDEVDDQDEEVGESDDHEEAEDQSDDQEEGKDPSDDADEDAVSDEEEVDDDQKSDTSKNSSRNDIAIQIEPDDDATEDPVASGGEEVDDEEESDSTAIRMESDDEVEPESDDEQVPPHTKCNSKRILFWVLCTTVLLALVGSVAFAIVAVVKANKKEPGKKETAYCLPIQSYNFSVDEQREGVYQTSLFSGLVTHPRMVTICDRIGKPVRNEIERKAEWFGAVFLNNKEEEKLFDTIIRDNMGNIFGELPDEKRLMWTGCIYKWKTTSKTWEWFCQNKNPFKDHQNFCNKTTWKEELTKLQADTKQLYEKDIYVVKDFGNENACWHLYNSKNLADIMGQPNGTIPRLSFACSSADMRLPSVQNQFPSVKNTSTNGHDAMPGFFQPKVASGNFLIYAVSATIEDAKNECESQNSTLVTIDNFVKLKEVEDALRKDSNYWTISDQFWTGGYMDVSNRNRKDFKWFGSPNTTTEYSTELFPNFSNATLDKSIKKVHNLIRQFRNQTKDCARSDYLYVGINHPKVPTAAKGLIILNPEGEVNQDRFKAYVLCEKKK